MQQRRKHATPVDEPTVFTEDLPLAAEVRFESEEAFFARSRRRRKAIQDGENLPLEATVSFASAQDLLAVLTPRRFELVAMVKRRGRYESIEALAEALGRDRSTVSRDIRALVDAGLLRVLDVAHAGHGRRSEIVPMAERMTIQLQI